MTKRWRHPQQTERGLLSTEFALLMPFLIFIALAAVLVGQLVRQESRTQAAADAAARAASYFVDDASEAETAARSAAEAVCRGSIDQLALTWTAPVLDTYTPGSVVVSVTCTESYAGWAPLRSAGGRSSSATAVATLEYWRPSS